MIYYKQCICSCCPGKMWFAEGEDFNPGGDPEWSNFYSWSCDTCGEYVSDADERFEFPEGY